MARPPHGPNIVASLTVRCGKVLVVADRTTTPPGEEQISALKEPGGSRRDVFSSEERAVLRFTGLLTSRPGVVEQRDLDELGRHFTEEQVLDLVVVIATANWTNRINDGLLTPIGCVGGRAPRTGTRLSGRSRRAGTGTTRLGGRETPATSRRSDVRAPRRFAHPRGAHRRGPIGSKRGCSRSARGPRPGGDCPIKGSQGR